VSGELHVSAALPQGETAHGNHWIGGRMSVRDRLDAVEKNLSPLSGIEPEARLSRLATSLSKLAQKQELCGRKCRTQRKTIITEL
jgi:hypothetical protein